MHSNKAIIFYLFILFIATACNNMETRTMEVTATAYNSTAAQTHRDHPNLTAWGDVLTPGMKVIAVSRDLIQLGLSHNTEVRIEGMPGKWRVLDKMNKRWTKKIDIYMGLDEEAAREWGKRKVTISWKVEVD